MSTACCRQQGLAQRVGVGACAVKRLRVGGLGGLRACCRAELESFLAGLRAGELLAGAEAAFATGAASLVSSPLPCAWPAGMPTPSPALGSRKTLPPGGSPRSRWALADLCPARVAPLTCSPAMLCPPCHPVVWAACVPQPGPCAWALHACPSCALVAGMPGE